MISRRLALLALAATALLALPSAAAADVEPNDGITQTEGPLTGGTTYSGSLSTENDEDWYSFYVSSQTQLDVSLSVPAGSACDPRFTLSDTDGGFIESERVDPNETFHFRYTTAAGTNRYLLSVSGCQGATYQFSLNPAASIVSGPGRAPAQGTPEPNDNESQAVGPLSGGQLYSASIDTQNDVDFFYFYSSGTQPFDVSLSPVTGCPPEAQLDGPGTESVDNRTSLSENRTSHIALTPPGQERYVLQVSGGCPGSAYEFRIDPPSAITTTPPPSFTPPPPTDSRCLSARNSVAKWSSKVKATKKALKRRGSRKRKRQLRDKLGAQKRNLKRAKVKVNRYC